MIRVSSIFGQMLQLFSRQEFEQAVAEHRAERHARGFSCWGQFVAMLFCHLGGTSPCARFAADWPPAKASCGTWGAGSPKRSTWPCQRASALGVVPRRVLSTVGRAAKLPVRMVSASTTNC